MDAADTIRNAVAQVAALRLDAASTPSLHAATVAIKLFQANRFSGTYADFLASAEYAGAARFFLEDLYSDKDYSLRDQQFARIAGALQRLFPQQVVATAVSLAELHMLTEELDRQMAAVWMADLGGRGVFDRASRYVACWRSVGREKDRYRQLKMMLNAGRELDRHTRTPGLRLMLKMMRRPASIIGLGSFHRLLESGFDTFAQMSGKGARANEFLRTIELRESAWIKRLSSGDVPVCVAELQTCLANVR